ncbi:hypothetical protein BGX29_004501 [Mortierella sp. GBA35]|nr:hypothetical protein BGX29_004501 [Mortierella sp. GBA35]
MQFSLSTVQHSRSSSSTLNLFTARRLSPVEIPELLEIIFSYIDNYTLRTSVVGVCRQWFLMNRHWVVREVIWDCSSDTKRLEVITSRLLGAGRLWWYSGRHSTMVRPGMDRWEALVKALKRTHERDLAIRQQQLLDRQRQPESVQIVMRMRPILYSSLRDLELVDHMNICDGLVEILPFLGTLTRLRLQVSDNGTICLGQIFLACPLLESFEADAKNFVRLPSPWVSNCINNTTQEHQQEHQRENITAPQPRLRPRLLPLQSLVLRNGHFAQSDLEALLAVTPRLQELKLISLRSGVWIEEDDSDLAQISKSTMACLETHGIVLRSFHFSLAYASKAGSQCAMFLETRNVVTRLEIHHQDRAKLLPDGGLHRYLCESPHLLHLKAPYAAYLLEHMDVHSRAQKTGTTKTTSGKTEVWACRNLQSLHLGIHVQQDYLRETKVHSRVIYGYLSTVCPKIRDLRIDPYYQAVLLPRPILFMDMDAGLCLLSRLKYLETLLIGSAGMTTTSGSRDLTWMIPSGWTAEARRERQKTVDGWQAMLQEEQQQTSPTATTSQRFEGPYVDTDVVESLRLLGLLEDVKATLKKMEEDVERGSYCWPLLQRLSINRPIELGRAPEAELRRLFPATMRTSFADLIPRPLRS